MKSLAVEFAGERLHLTSARAVWWPARRALLVADVHLGKGAAFRLEGIAIPAGGSAHDLERLSQLITHYEARTLYILGDFVHASPSEALIERVTAWRKHHRATRVTLVRGNHDRHLAHLPDSWHIAASAHVALGALTLVHAPPAQPIGGVVSGHIHPCLQLRDGKRDRLRLPVYWLRDGMLVVPAFGGFTGGYEIEPRDGDRVFVVHDEVIMELPATGAGARTRHR